jgi:hypothetical protein
VEQRISSSNQPLEGAGFDPAFIPGLVKPENEEADTTAEPEAPADGKDVSEEPVSAEDGAPDESEAPEESEEPADGPAFEASDRRAKIVADRKGVRLTLDDQECEFRWDEIGAVETESPRFGKRFTVTVHTPDRRWYPIEIEATARARFPEWEQELDAVLDAYFEDADQPAPGAS